MALMAILSDAELRGSEASSLTRGDIALGRRLRPHHRHLLQYRYRGPGRGGGGYTRRMRALFAIRTAGVGSGGSCSESQIARRVKAIAKAAGLADWEFFSGRVGMAQNGAPTHEIERQGRRKQGGGMVVRYTRGESAGSALRYL